MNLGSLEEKLMHHIWNAYPNTPFCVRNVRDSINNNGTQYAYNTILTVITHLHQKGLLTRNAQGKTYEYTVALTQNDYVAQVSKTAFEELQKQYGPLAIAHFAHLVESVDPDLLAEAKKHLQSPK